MPPVIEPAIDPTNARARSLAAYLDELVEQFDALPFTSRARGDLAGRIRAVQDELGACGGL